MRNSEKELFIAGTRLTNDVHINVKDLSKS